MNQADKPIANPVVVLREEFDDWAVLFNPDTAEALGINPVGVIAWKVMDGQHTLAEIVAEIRERCSDVPDNVADEIAAFAKNLAEHGFVGYELAGGN
jgi:SynChlorMet cassette protein ScmD